MAPKRFADTTTLPISKSRFEIDEILRRWGCNQIMWADDFEQGRVRLRFVWARDTMSYMARFDLQLPTDEDLRSEARHASSRAFMPAKYERLKLATGKSEHRRLLLWLKATFEAVESGIIELLEALALPRGDRLGPGGFDVFLVGLE